VNEDWSFRCTACGRCCNSGPELSVPELFRHQHRFIGRLAVRRVRRVGAGESAGGPSEVLLVTHAWHDERLARCPALAEDGRCALHAENKPLVCAVAPLDALEPDALQHRVLAQRAREAAYFGADCLAEGAPALAARDARGATLNPSSDEAATRDGFVPLVRRLLVV
jgi:Fe-S-cluster containining protein